MYQARTQLLIKTVLNLSVKTSFIGHAHFYNTTDSIYVSICMKSSHPQGGD